MFPYDDITDVIGKLNLYTDFWQNEAMTGAFTTGSTISRVTLALMEDTGFIELKANVYSIYKWCGVFME